jgi:alpha-L-rhamnosidase
VTPFTRRSFLAGGVQVSAAATVWRAHPFSGAADSAPPPARLVGASATTRNDGSSLRVGDLTVNGTADPLGVDPDDCNFAWKLSATGRGATQHSYRISVHSADPGGAAVWDSGPIASARQAFVAYGGPPLRADTAYRWAVQARDAEGRWSASTTGHFVTSLRAADWRGVWLQPSAASDQPNRVTYLRTRFTPPRGTVARATAVVSAAHKFLMFANGSQIGAGPSFSYPDEQYAQSFDLTGAIRPGRPNVFGVLHHWYGPGQGRPASAPGLIAQLSVHYSDGRVAVFGTDRGWKEHPAEWLPSAQRNGDGGDFVEWVDGQAHPQGWAGVAFDDRHWTPATPWGATSPFSAIYAQRTAVTDHPMSPVHLHRLPNGSLVADFGAIYAARLRVTFAKGVAGWSVPMRVGYLLDADGQVSTLHGTQGTDLSFTYITRDGAQTFEALTYLGFRYLQIDDPPEQMDANQLVAVATHATMPSIPMATFRTPDRMLNAVWNLNARSCLYCTHEQFVDTPTREKGQFVWDASNESEAVMGAYGDQNMSWQGLRDVARGQARYWPDGQVNAVYPNGDGARTFATFSARYPEWLWRYYVATGDRATALRLYPSVARVGDFLWSGRDGATGLLTGFAEGSNGDPVYGYDQKVAADTVSNALAVNAFTRIAALADLAGDAASAAGARGRATQLVTAINARLVRSDGVYVDGLEPDGSQSAHASQAANALPLAYGVVPADRRATVGAYVSRLGIALGPNHGLELLRGLGAAGLVDQLVQLLTDASRPGWAHIVASGGTFTWETWIPSDLIGDSLSHGWGSSALVAMQEILLGVTLQPPADSAGTVIAAIAPPTSGLSAARGTLPTIAGPLGVEWSRARGRTSLRVDVPANAAALVTLPARDAAAVREGGRPATRAPGVAVQSVAGGQVMLGVGSGTYRFSVQG